MTEILKSLSLLFIVPHFKAFIRDQVNYVKPYIRGVTILMPTALFSHVVLRLPYLERYFRSLRLTVESYSDLQDYRYFCPKYFTLPIETLRKRNCYLATKSCVNVIFKNNVDFDLIHAHFLENGFIGARLKNIYEKPLVVTAHGYDVYDLPFKNRWYNSLAKLVLTEADQVITVSKSNAEKLLSLGVSPNKLHIIPNGYDENLFKPLPMSKAREKLSLPQNKKILLSVGNLVDKKGHTYLISAMPLVLRKRKDVLLIIVGSGPLKELLQSMIKKYGLEDYVILAGGRRHEEIPLWINASDIFILPSLQEGFPTVIPEAMACGKPIVATNVGGLPEAINNDIGMLVKPASSRELALSILEALERKWNQEAILSYATRYSWRNIVGQIINVYEKTLS